MCLQNSVRERLDEARLYLESNENCSHISVEDTCDYLELADCQDIPISVNDLCIMQMNIQGLINKQTDVYLALKSITQMKKVDVVILVETWLTTTSENRINIPGYVYVGTPRLRKKGGGVGFLIRENITDINRHDLGIKSDIIENHFIEIKCSKLNIIVGSIYRPPNTLETDFLSSMKVFIEKYQKINKNQKELILGMDHNLDLLKHNTHIHTQQFIELLMDGKLIPTITRPTRVTTKSATLLDNIILSVDLYVKQNSCIITHDMSDHFPCLTIIRNCNYYAEGSMQLPKRKLTEKNLQKIKENLLQVNWDLVLTNRNAQDSMSAFHEQLIAELDRVAPERNINVSTNQVLNIAWMTPGLLKCSKKQL